MNYRHSLNVKLLPRQCGTENLTDVHYTEHFKSPFSLFLVLSPLMWVAYQEDNTMTESEERGVREQKRTSQGWEGQWRAACPELLLYQVFRMSSGQTTTDSCSRQAVWRTNPPSPPHHSLAQGQHDKYKMQNYQQNDHNSNVISVILRGCSKLIYCVKGTVLRWGGISFPLPFLNSASPPSPTSGFPLLNCYAIHCTYGSFLRYF